VEGQGLEAPTPSRATASNWLGDLQPRALCRRLGFYQPSMNENTSLRAWFLDFNDVRAMSSHSSVEKKLSAIALSYASPTDPVDGLMPVSMQRCPNATEVYWQPLSE
jgi:hypothetical protein